MNLLNTILSIGILPIMTKHKCPNGHYTSRIGGIGISGDIQFNTGSAYRKCRTCRWKSPMFKGGKKKEGISFKIVEKAN